MKILFVSTSTEAGGAEKILFDLALSLAKNNEVRVISIYPEGYYAQKLKESGIWVKSLNAAKTPRVKHFTDLKKEIVSFKPDVVHAFLYRAIQMCRMLKTPDFKLFTTPHTNYAAMGKFARIVDAALKSKDTRSLAESESTRNFLLIHQRYPEKQVILTSNSITDNFKKDFKQRTEMREAQKAGDKFVILCAARFSPEKGLLFLLEAFAKIYNKNKNAVLWLAGEGDEKPLLDIKCIELGIKDAVKFLGFCENMAQVYNGADLFVLPSLTESLPLAAIEAAACGLPLVLTNVGDNNQICEHGVNGFLATPKDSILLACLIQEIMDNEQQRNKFSRESISKAKNFKQDTAKQHLKIYTS
ncbi:glycosyltransferase involved in cell wall biosynthesis [Elusimicrobium posterum]|uniref:glycosyltransferase n=1 Tax=Elusimicrobium posterum TaxID=3116653 RepID=UPI003C774B82